MDATGPAPTLASLLTEDLHLAVSCGKCGHEARLTAAAACLAFGEDATMVAIMRKAKCSACGAKGRDRAIDARPCSLDVDTKRALESARRDHARRPDAHTTARVADAEAEWEFLRTWTGDMKSRSDFVRARQGLHPLPAECVPSVAAAKLGIH